MTKIDPKSWTVWAAACLVALFAADHPIMDLLVASVAVAVGSAAGRKPSPLRTLMILGVSLVTFRTITFALTGHTGEVVLFALPSLELPELLGGASLGGAVTAEVVLTSIAEGLRLIAVMAVFGAYFSVTETSQLIKLLPAFLFEAGLVVGISVAFVPTLARTAREIREAQVMRGSKRRAAPLVVPILSTSLDRSLSLAESMDSRGYGRTRTSEPQTGYRITVAVALAVALSAASLLVMGDSSVLVGIAGVSGTAVGLITMAKLSRSIPRTRYRQSRWGPTDSVIVAISLVAIAGAVAFVSGGYNAYTAIVPSAPHLAAVVSGLVLLVPIYSARART